MKNHSLLIPSLSLYVYLSNSLEVTILIQMGTSEDRSEIAFFDVETTFPTADQRRTIWEFGSILVCPTTLVELDFYSTLVRPSDPSLISSLLARRDDITRYDVVSAPSFIEIADIVYDILHGLLSFLSFFLCLSRPCTRTRTTCRLSRTRVRARTHAHRHQLSFS